MKGLFFILFCEQNNKLYTKSYLFNKLINIYEKIIHNCEIYIDNPFTFWL